MSRIVTLTRRIYTALLRWYPRELREQFGAELLTVFTVRAQAARQRGVSAVLGVLWSELRDLPGITLRARRTNGGRPPWIPQAATLAVMAPFLLNALIQAGNGLNRVEPRIGELLQPRLGLAVISVWALIILIGVVRGLPDWSLPSIGVILGIISVAVNGGVMIGGVDIPIPWRIIYPDWVPWFGALLLPLLALVTLLTIVCAVLPWLRPLFRRWRADWTRLSLLLYGFVPITLEMFDMHPYETPLTIAGLLVLATGAGMYLHSSTQRRRALALGGAVTLMLIVVTVGSIVPTGGDWLVRFPPEHTLLQGLIGWFWLLGILFTPALLGLLPRNTAPTAPVSRDSGNAESADVPQTAQSELPDGGRRSAVRLSATTRAP